MSSPVRLALVGAGAMGSLHARVIAEHPDAKLAVVVDPDRPAGEALATRFESTWAQELGDLDRYDAVVVATPTSTHFEWATIVLESGTPLLVEKPVASELPVVESIVATARQRGVPMTCGFLERFNPALRTGLELIPEPLHVTAIRHSPYAPRIATGVAFDLLLHDVDLVTRLTGREPDLLAASFAYLHPSSAPGAEDVADVTMQYDTGMLAMLSASRISHRKQRMILINDLERLVEIDLVRQDVTVYHHVQNAALEDGTGYRQQTIIDIPTIQRPREPLMGELEHFIALVRGDADADAELDSILPPHRVVDAAHRVAAAGT